MRRSIRKKHVPQPAHAKEAAPSDGPFLAKADYLSLWKAQREVTLSVLDELTDEQLAQPTGIPFAPTVAALMNLVGLHPLMHAGQFVAVRRSLGKPIAI